MKKLLIPLFLLLFFVSGCGNSNVSKEYLKESDIKGYWRQVEENRYGEITDLSDRKYAYLEITDTRLFFYKYYEDTDTSGVSEKYYKLENDKIYYDYYELKGNDWKENLDELSGGIFNVSIDNDRLILIEYSDEDNKDEGNVKETYIKVEAKDWPIEE